MNHPGTDVLGQAIAWRVQMLSGDCPAEHLAACQAWRQAHPENERVWQQLESLSQGFSGLPQTLAHATLDGAQHDAKRRKALKLLGLLLASGSLGLGAQQLRPWEDWLADASTGTGERRRVELADGGLLYLNSGTAVAFDYSPQQRRLRLYHGEILVQTAPDPSHRPFQVDTAHGRVTALGTRFQLRDFGDHCLAAVYQGAVEIGTTAPHTQRLEADQQCLFSKQHISTPTEAQESATSWIENKLVASSMPLGELVSELARHRPGLLRCAPDVAQLPISGVYPLGDSDRALQAITRTLPVRLVYRSPYWVTVTAAG
ncbi:FecR family protein [Pseudomonas sp. ABC1]|uniref:FecR domain-containing protein n=1 Tax=Pseudomonas sp. ABC1 TaxID=2748080 RepID=UPI0015C3591F|nr:FecR family protein [Pseudomonas sp. ABC1]QLF92866.1 FecR family protein [Pseudomonas sp. ABC1]